MNITFVKSGQVQFEEREYYIAFGRINLLLRGDLKSHTTSALTRHFTGLYIMQKKSVGAFSSTHMFLMYNIVKYKRKNSLRSHSNSVGEVLKISVTVKSEFHWVRPEFISVSAETAFW
ncbi:hypothetical protein T4B_13261 [Trichinella pseudospiralis]|uniref:Uncharacterized protein n=1 Tax=Trichinella pseudospiralis TaxID=6337 RepID=A0A0V1HQN5_TRIPS|nr:hypothetical protein T4B_13261 [Trichinella pseudospiralis]